MSLKIMNLPEVLATLKVLINLWVSVWLSQKHHTSSTHTHYLDNFAIALLDVFSHSPPTKPQANPKPSFAFDQQYVD